MASPRAFQLAARLATITSALMFGLIVVGSVVRTTDSGLACPDWPLCHGRLIPPFEFNVLIEWAHRLLALCVGLLLFATAGTVLASRETRAALGGLAALGVALYFTQALLGALTVWRLLDPAVVSGHLAVGLLLFSTLVLTALVAHAAARAGESPAAAPARPEGLLPLFGIATFLAWAQAVLGGMVSTNHAGLACPDWPTCNGEWFPALSGLVGLQASHRWGAYLLTGVLLAVSWASRRSPDRLVRGIGRTLPWLVLAQVALGVTNVRLKLPVWVSALHLAGATAILAVLLVATFRTAALRATRVAWAEAGAR
jgi:cytochrome c oxidase assembly protein subunit 15